MKGAAKNMKERKGRGRNEEIPKVLIKSSKRSFRDMKKRAGGDRRGSEAEKWLKENYFILERESKHVLRELKGIGKVTVCEGEPIVYKGFKERFFGMTEEITEETVEDVLRRINEETVLSVKEFDFAPTALKCALLMLAKEAVIEDDAKKIGFAVRGLVKMQEIDFTEITEKVSEAEKLLLQDASGIYRVMDEKSRAYYRYLAARIAKNEGKEETEIIKKAVESGKHVGFYLTEHFKDRNILKKKGTAILVFNIVAGIFLSAVAGVMLKNWIVAFLLFLPFWEVVRIMTERLSVGAAPVDTIVAIDADKAGIKESKTIVVVSELVPDTKKAKAIAEKLKKMYFANRDMGIDFCILADFRESAKKEEEGDSEKVEVLEKEIEKLNEELGGRFIFAVRKRRYSKTQGKYSGWERKRGAITEFIRYIKSGEDGSFYKIGGDVSRIREKKYMIALDADTNLLFGSAKKMISAAMHPLNVPRVDRERGIVTSGYGILVPRMATELESINKTFFSKVMSGGGQSGQYEYKARDMYQDFFGEAIFSGKGLINIDAYYELLDTSVPEGKVLSHDIAEGAVLRVGYLSDVELTDESPKDMSSWLMRANRWIRGDWQNVIFLGKRYRCGGEVRKNSLNLLSKYKLADNLRRSLTSVAAMTGIVYAAFCKNEATAAVVSVVSLASALFESILSALLTVIDGGLFIIVRRRFTHSSPRVLKYIALTFFNLVMLAQNAVNSVIAISKTVYRMTVSKKNLLEWVCAADAARKGFWREVKRYLPSEIIGAVLLFSEYSLSKMCGMFLLLAFPVALLSAKVSPKSELKIKESDRKKLWEYCSTMFKFYEDYAGEEDNFLPVDNMQQAPVYLVAHRTSPTNIGLMMLSQLAARDFGFIDSMGLFLRVSRTLSTVEKLEKWNGHLYNWYNTETLEVLHPAFVSAVDSGNFICSLVALKEGLKEYQEENIMLKSLVARIERVIEGADIGVFYDKKRKLLSIGYDAESGKMSGSHYDFLMSEARMTSYYAVAAGQVEKKHWGVLSRMMSRSGLYAGLVSWTGTMFEYFMPQILLTVYKDSMIEEALKYCIYCQKQGALRGTPWGISESAYYNFDRNLAYQYKAHGVDKLRVKGNTKNEVTVSPYSSFLTLPFYFKGSMKNLEELEEEGMYSKYGFFEAVSYKNEGEKNKKNICRSYMAHHVGMSILAAANAAFGGIMQKRFMADNFMGSAKELLREGAERDGVMYDGMKSTNTERRERAGRGGTEALAGVVECKYPNVTALSNGELCDIISDTGENALMYAHSNVNRETIDSLRYPHGIYVFASVKGKCSSFTKAPFYDEEGEYKAQITSRSVKYMYKGEELSGSVECAIHPTLALERRAITVKNISGVSQRAEILIYFEPILSKSADYNAHPAFSKLFVTAKYNEKTGAVVFERRCRSNEKKVCCAVGFAENIEYEYETRREKLFGDGNGYESLKNFEKVKFEGGDGTPDCCMAIKIKLSLAPNQRVSFNLLISAAREKEEALAAILKFKKSELKLSRPAISPVFNRSIEGVLAAKLLTRIKYPIKDKRSAEARRVNTLPLRALWGLSISGDNPIVVYEAKVTSETEVLRIYSKILKRFKENGIKFDFVILYSESELGNFREKAEEALLQAGITRFLQEKDGVYIVETDKAPKEQINLIYAASVLTVFEGFENTENARVFLAQKKLLNVERDSLAKKEEKALKTYGGDFVGERFYVEKESAMPYCNVLANSVFGTLVSDRSPGFTWAVNSRENKLTPWNNDFAMGDWGELLLFSLDGEIYNLTSGALASFSPKDAWYEGKIREKSIRSKVKIRVSETGCVKYCDVTIFNDGEKEVKGEFAYYIETVLGVDSKNAAFLRSEFSENTLYLTNPANVEVKCQAGLSASEKILRVVCSKPRFLAGEWNKNILNSDSEWCGSVITGVKIPAKSKKTVTFKLGYGATRRGLKEMLKTEPRKSIEEAGRIKIDTPNEYLDAFINVWCPNQTMKARLCGRTSFYQNGGAYGFRDQLQDVCSIASLDPKTAKRQILRAASVQFPEGDVMHWWHNLPKSAGGLKGVRTRYSDDLLWLPYAVSKYIKTTGDKSILDIEVPYLEGKELEKGEKERYFETRRLDYKESIYAHCLRAIRRGYKTGEKGMPLIGGGDWNDGFNNVGAAGKGESVWLAMFLKLVIEEFVLLCEYKEDDIAEEELREYSKKMKKSVEEHAWDERWYLRAFYDDGSKMGSKENDECVIDILPQSFAVLSKITDDKSRLDTALESAYEHLVDEKWRIVKLFKGAFGDGMQNPGYIKVYPKGIRENGGQYSHAGVWFAMALLRHGLKEKGEAVIDMLNPASRCADYELYKAYELEPYAMAADIYTNSSCFGRGGWSLYTGAAGWYYTAVIEELLGIKMKGAFLEIDPQIPDKWNGYQAEINVKNTTIHLEVTKGSEEKKIYVDGKERENILLDGGEYDVKVEIGE